jgi:hypothetical protein
MAPKDSLSPVVGLIPLAEAFLGRTQRAETEAALRNVVKSVAFELVENGDAFRLLGQDVSYHKVDPFLPEVLKRFGEGLTLDDVASYRSSTPLFDLCFEDCWTGYFIAKQLQMQASRGDLLLIHLDDHADMMPTLLCRSTEALVNPVSGETFDPASSSNWESAIRWGAVTIGNFMTPLFYLGTSVHVRHINNTTKSEERWHVSRDSRQYDLIPEKRFATVNKDHSRNAESIGTYWVGSSPEAVLDCVDHPWTLVHIDLDYFINDFNGTSRGDNYFPSLTLQVEAKQKMERFFKALTRLSPTVDRWLIATSPGFCASFHWEFLLQEISRSIEEFARSRAAGA